MWAFKIGVKVIQSHQEKLGHYELYKQQLN